MPKQLQIRLWNEEEGAPKVYTQQFVALKHVLAWMKLEEEIASELVREATVSAEIDGIVEPIKASSIFERRITLIADLFDHKDVTFESIMERGNAMDKLIVQVQQVVMNQYSDADEKSTPGKD